MKRTICAAVLLLLALSPVFAQQSESFSGFVASVWSDAKAQGIPREIFDAAFAGVTPDPRVMALTKRQPEYGKPFGAYVNSIVSKANINTGVKLGARWRDTLNAIEKRFEVDRSILLAIWGMETSYGALKDKWDVIRSLATLAHARFRQPYFRDELITALKILQEEHIPRDRMLGSWAGAMGQTQFMPSNFMQYAIDFDGDGRRDIWTSVPDVLASTANYFRKEGWTPGMTWGFEVGVPKGFDYRKSRASFAEWAKLGLLRADGAAMPQRGDAILFFPAGAGGPAFLVTENFIAIKRYNNSDAYALAVGHLADRIRGAGPIRAAWPKDDRQPTREERIALQKKLAERGYKVRNFTGHFDFDLRDAIREVQERFGMVPDGHPSPAFLARIGVDVQ
jgi:membrane-bound lytic murein transglycosylase B